MQSSLLTSLALAASLAYALSLYLEEAPEQRESHASGNIMVLDIQKAVSARRHNVEPFFFNFD